MCARARLNRSTVAHHHRKARRPLFRRRRLDTKRQRLGQSVCCSPRPTEVAAKADRRRTRRNGWPIESRPQNRCLERDSEGPERVGGRILSRFAGFEGDLQVQLIVDRPFCLSEPFCFRILLRDKNPYLKTIMAVLGV